MSLTKEQKQLQDLLEIVKDMAENQSKILEVVGLFNDQMYDTVTEAKDEVFGVIKSIHSFLHDIIEPNQKTLYAKLKEIGGEIEAAEETTTEE